MKKIQFKRTIVSGNVIKRKHKNYEEYYNSLISQNGETQSVIFTKDIEKANIFKEDADWVFRFLEDRIYNSEKLKNDVVVGCYQIIPVTFIREL